MSTRRTTRKTIIVWLRRDLRLADNPALSAAVQDAESVVPVFIWNSQEESPWMPGAASRWWLHYSIVKLDTLLRKRGSRLILRQGNSVDVLALLVRETGASAVYRNRVYEPATIERDKKVQASLTSSGIEVCSFNASLLKEPWDCLNRQGKPFQVFTPFWRSVYSAFEPASSMPAPKRIAAPAKWPGSDDFDTLGLLPSVDWASGLRGAWQPGEKGAREALDRFVDESLVAYVEGRDQPGIVGTSRLSPHLHFGEISSHAVWRAIREHATMNAQGGLVRAEETFLRQLAWREFAHHLLVHFPHTPEKPLRTQFDRFPWRKDPAALHMWQRGQTGYPLVDAGMRELWATGWMHNRVRMVVASFLVKHLLVHWIEGARWFWDTLVDADLANNTLGWQWTAGCGADAAPYFRVFNPVLQGRKFDPDGAYVRRWVPELAALPDRWLYEPFKAPASVLKDAAIKLGKTYPRPIVDHEAARTRALMAYDKTRRSQ